MPLLNVGQMVAPAPLGLGMHYNGLYRFCRASPNRRYRRRMQVPRRKYKHEDLHSSFSSTASVLQVSLPSNLIQVAPLLPSMILKYSTANENSLWRNNK